ncbi:aminoacyl tRNA synthase complex-interacting multifunctional protein 1 [Nelusetta ayraudi]|uniref:aminoacyl tRNA synthase complex-interacting multifunctional protein 1 n=1 Tax=Nelusetta ayraudi TaxID=303726 RepID=UPI003F6E81B6
MENSDGLFNPSLASTLKKLDPENGEQILDYFQTHALLARDKALLQSSVRDQKKLLVENSKLKKDIEQLRTQLQDKQRRRTYRPLFSPPKTPSFTPTTPANQLVSPTGQTDGSLMAPPPHSSQVKESGRRRGQRKACLGPEPVPLEAEPRIDVSRLDLRVGRIRRVRRHPMSTMQSVQEVDVGESAPRTIVSRLAETTNFEELQGALVVLLCNIKACRQRGVISQARLLFCFSSDTTELLVPPSGSTPGDRVTFLNYPGEPDRELQSKQRIWELLQPHLQVDSRGVANYKGSRFEVKGKGLCRSRTLTSCGIR